MAHYTRNPTSDHAVSGSWSGTPGSRYTKVDDYPDSSTDWLTCSTSSGYIEFGYTDFAVPSAEGGVASVRVLAMFDWEDAAIQGRLVVNGTVYNSTLTFYGRHDHAAIFEWTKNPDTDAAWTVDDVNGSGSHPLEYFGVYVDTATPTIYSVQCEAIGGACITIDPTSDHAFSGDWSPSAPRYDEVDDYPDDNTDKLIAGPTIGRGLTNYTSPSLSQTATVTEVVVQVMTQADTTEGVFQAVNGTLHINGSSYDHGTTIDPPYQVRLYEWSWTKNPRSDDDWTVDDINRVGDDSIQAFGIRTTLLNLPLWFWSWRIIVYYTPSSYYWGAVDIHSYATVNVTAWKVGVPPVFTPPSMPSRPTYQVWLLEDDYTKKALLKNWTSLEYTTAINGYAAAYLEFDPTNLRIPDIEIMDRLLIVRNGMVVFGGIILRNIVRIPNTAPSSEKYNIAALDTGCYADWRIVVPPDPSVDEWDERTGCADDLAKEYVDVCMGPGAIAARRFLDVTVVSDLSAAPSLTYQARNVILQTVLENLHNQAGFDWKFVPLEDGVEFKTMYPYWGTDHRRGNGVNDEVIFSIDRRNFDEIEWNEDLLRHYNHFFVWGQGEGTERAWVEGEDETAVALYKRRERYADARHIELEASLGSELDAAIYENRPYRAMSVTPHPWTWGETWDLGDLITLDIKRYGLQYTVDVQVTSIHVTVQDEKTETVMPDVEVVY